MITSPPAGPMLAVQVLPGRLQYAPVARRWVGELTAAAGCAPGDPQLAAAELFANAVRHTRSGTPGGVVTVIVATGPGGAVVHVHDQGADGGQVPYARLGQDAGSAESGRGLRLVAAISVHWASGPAAWCRQAAPGDPAVAAGGCCVCCHVPSAVAASCAVRDAATSKIPRPRPASPDGAESCCPLLLTWDDAGLLPVRNGLAHPASPVPLVVPPGDRGSRCGPTAIAVNRLLASPGAAGERIGRLSAARK